MNIFILLLPALLLLTLIVATTYFYLGKKRKKTTLKISNISSTVEFLEFQNDITFNPKKKKLEFQSKEWRQAMLEVGEKLELLNCKNIFFVHGTFVGSDPVGMTKLIHLLFPERGEKFENKIQTWIKRSTDIFVGEAGNFTQKYVSLFQSAIQKPIDCHLFQWSSENHHTARIKGLIKLCLAIVENHTRQNKKGMILLIGHSHAGQIFALLSHLLESTETGNKLIKFMESNHLTQPSFTKTLGKLKDIPIRFVTYGTPAYYLWAPLPKQTLVHFINHRGQNFSTSNRKGALFTKYGDYIQQLGVAGSDFPASSASERRLNALLDSILGTHKNSRNDLLKNEKFSKLPNEGHVLLIDYKDNSKSIPNGPKTIFGHGIYTQYHVLHFNTDCYLDYFIGNKRKGSKVLLK